MILVTKCMYGCTFSAVPSYVSLLILHTQVESGAYSRDSSGFPRRCLLIPSTATGSVPSSYQVTQLFIDGLHCRESASTGPVVLKVVPVTGAAFLGITMDHFLCLSFPTPTFGTVDMYVRYRKYRVYGVMYCTLGTGELIILQGKNRPLKRAKKHASRISVTSPRREYRNKIPPVSYAFMSHYHQKQHAHKRSTVGTTKRRIRQRAARGLTASIESEQVTCAEHGGFVEVFLAREGYHRGRDRREKDESRVLCINK